MNEAGRHGRVCNLSGLGRTSANRSDVDEVCRVPSWVGQPMFKTTKNGTEWAPRSPAARTGTSTTTARIALTT